MASRRRQQQDYDRRHPVHYLKDGPFKDHRENVPERMIGDILAELAGNYVPIQGMALKTTEIRKLNKAIDVLEIGPAGGYFALEDEDFNILKEVIVTLAENTNLARSAPVIEDILNSATTDMPVFDEMVTRMRVVEHDSGPTEGIVEAPDIDKIEEVG
jgi:hypothetical protein